MSGFTPATRAILRLAAWIAGPERAEWVAAMAAETHAAGEAGLSWACGSLVTAVRDRTARDWHILVALVILPGSAAAFGAVIGAFAEMAMRSAGLGGGILVPTMLTTSWGTAYLLGRIKPSLSPVIVASLAFLLYLATPAAILAVAAGIPFHLLWSPNVTIFNLPWQGGIVLGWLAWLTGCWVGTRDGSQSRARG